MTKGRHAKSGVMTPSVSCGGECFSIGWLTYSNPVSIWINNGELDVSPWLLRWSRVATTGHCRDISYYEVHRTVWRGVTFVLRKKESCPISSAH
jgi:hypothetical protein